MLQALDRHLPGDWSVNSTVAAGFTIEISPDHTAYDGLANKVSGPFNLGIKKIVKLEDPFMYGHFLLKKAEYEARGGASVVELFHVTSGFNAESILRRNFDWRMVRRGRFGYGTSFGVTPEYANYAANWNIGTDRAMIVTDVLYYRGYEPNDPSSDRIPIGDYDTAVGYNRRAYVKFDDHEFYPKYVVYYTSEEPVRWSWGVRF